MIGTIPAYTQLPLCIDPGAHYFQLDHIKRDTAVCTRCGLIRKQSTALPVLPVADQSVLRSGGQTKEYGPRPRIATARPRPDR